MTNKLFELVRNDCRYRFCTGKKDLTVCKQQCAEAQHLVDTLIAGGVVILPVKPGDTVYTICRGKIKEWTVYYIGMNSLGEFTFNITDADRQNSREIMERWIGDLVFLTEEDATNKLKERKK